MQVGSVNDLEDLTSAPSASPVTDKPTAAPVSTTAPTTASQQLASDYWDVATTPAADPSNNTTELTPTENGVGTETTENVTPNNDPEEEATQEETPAEMGPTQPPAETEEEADPQIMNDSPTSAPTIVAETTDAADDFFLDRPDTDDEFLTGDTQVEAEEDPDWALQPTDTDQNEFLETSTTEMDGNNLASAMEEIEEEEEEDNAGLLGVTVTFVVLILFMLVAFTASTWQMHQTSFAGMPPSAGTFR